MKKKLLIIFIITAMLAAVICVLTFGGAFEKEDKTSSTTTTTSRSTTTTTNQDPSQPEITFEHGDNFTEDDIEFIKRFNGYQTRFIEPAIYSFSGMIDNVKSGKGYLYFAEVDIDNPYYICAYIDFEKWDPNYLDVTKYVWYKFEDKEPIPEEIEGMRIGWSFHIYDAIIIKNVGNGTDHEQPFRYYKFTTGSPLDVIGVCEYLLLHCFESVDQISMIEERYRWQRCYQGNLTSNSETYLTLYSNAIHEDGSFEEADNRAFLGDYYDALSPYIQRVEEFDYDFINTENKTVKILYLGISIDDLTKVVFERK